MKTQMCMATIPRWHCVDRMIKNIDLAEKPDNISLLLVATDDEKGYVKYIERAYKKIFKEVNVVINENAHVMDHVDVRKGGMVGPNLRKKTVDVYLAYELLRNSIDEKADEYWIIEDDTLFPISTYPRYKTIMDAFNADSISGISYDWETDTHIRNFWSTFDRTLLPGGKEMDNAEVYPGEKIGIGALPLQKSGAVLIGATGLGNVIVKGEAFRKWHPMEWIKEVPGADISMFWCLEKLGYKNFGIWDHFLPHMTQYENGDFEIIGRCDESLHAVI